jgi:transposase
MEKTFKSCDRKQMLLPPSLMDWLPKDHLVYFLLDVVEQLDLSKIYGSYKGDGRGQPPYEPGMMTALLERFD